MTLYDGLENLLKNGDHKAVKHCISRLKLLEETVAQLTEELEVMYGITTGGASPGQRGDGVSDIGNRYQPGVFRDRSGSDQLRLSRAVLRVLPGGGTGPVA